MAFGAGKSGVFKLDATSGGSLTAYSEYITNISMSASADLGDVTTMGDSSRERIKLLKDFTFSVDFVCEPTFTAVLKAHQDASVTTSFEISPMGSGSGTPKYTGEAFLSDFSITGSVDGVVTGSASFSASGDTTLGSN